jgi:hypothetical protein
MEKIDRSLTSVLLDRNEREVRRDVPVHDLVETLKNSKDIGTVIFDGVITQRLLEVAVQQKIKTIVGVKKSTPLDIPKFIEVLTKEEL